MALLAALTLAVSACSTAEAPVPQLRTVLVSRPVPEAAKRPCKAPVAMPTPIRRMPAEEVTSKWAADRAALRECEARRRAAVDGAL